MSTETIITKEEGRRRKPTGTGPIAIGGDGGYMDIPIIIEQDEGYIKKDVNPGL